MRRSVETYLRIKGIGKAEFARELGISPAYVSLLLTEADGEGKKDWTFDLACKFADLQTEQLEKMGAGGIYQ